MSNPNERELRERDAQDREREETTKDIKERYIKGMEKELKRKSKADKQQDDTDSDASVKIQSARLGIGPTMNYMAEKGKQLEKEKVARKEEKDARVKTRQTWRVKSDNTDSARSYAEVASSSTASRSSKGPNKQTEAKRVTSQYAKDMLRDADLAREVYDRIQRNLTQDFTNIQWWQRPEGDMRQHERHVLVSCMRLRILP